MDLAHWLLWSGPLLKNRHEIKPFPVEWATLFVSSRNLLHGIVVARSSPFSFSGGLSAALLFTGSISIESSSPQLDPHVHVPAASVNGLCNFLICTEPRQSSVGLLKTRTSSQSSYIYQGMVSRMGIRTKSNQDVVYSVFTYPSIALLVVHRMNLLVFS